MRFRHRRRQNPFRAAVRRTALRLSPRAHAYIIILYAAVVSAPDIPCATGKRLQDSATAPLHCPRRFLSPYRTPKCPGRVGFRGASFANIERNLPCKEENRFFFSVSTVFYLPRHVFYGYRIPDSPLFTKNQAGSHRMPYFPTQKLRKMECRTEVGVISPIISPRKWRHSRRS